MRVETSRWCLLPVVLASCLKQPEQRPSPPEPAQDVPAIAPAEPPQQHWGSVVRTVYPGRPGPVDGEPPPTTASIPPTSSEPASKTGGISNAAQVVSQMRPHFRACYQQALGNDPNLSGNVRVRIRVGADGTIDSVTGYSTNLPTALVDCIVTRATEQRFEPPDGGVAIVNVPVNLVRQGPRSP